MFRFAPQAQLLVFRHPRAGIQLVKGSIEVGEAAHEAALRELREEAGIEGAVLAADLGVWDSGHEGQVWSFHACHVDRPLPDRWIHRVTDDGGHDFEFFWHPLGAQATAEWHEVYRRALAYIRCLPQGGLRSP